MNQDDIITYCARKHYSLGYARYWTEHVACEACGRPSEPPHHIRTRGAGGKDDSRNLLGLCVEHHREIHATGSRLFGVAFKHLASKIARALEASRKVKV